MSDQTHDTKATAQAAPTAETTGAAPAQPAAAAVHSMLARGQHDPKAFASVIQSHPQAKAQIISLLHQTLGNGFVQAVLSVVAPGVANAIASTTGGETPMRVTANGLHVRSSPDKANDSNIVSTLPQHDTVKATGQHGEWTQIEHEAKPAFAFGQYLAPTAPAVPTKQPATPVSTPVASALASPVETAAPAGGTLNLAPDPAHVDKHATDKHHDKHAHHAHGEKKPKTEKTTRYTKYGGGRVKTVLAKLVQERGLQSTISGREIAQLDGLSEVETGGNVAAVDTTDDEVVSIGFHQIVLGDLSIQEVMQKVPAAFAKHGLELDTSAKYDVKSKPFRIKGVEHPDTLRTREWGDKFYDASAEPDVILAIAEYALKEKKLVAKITEKAGGTGDWFQDITAETWLLEMHNSRPGWVGAVVKRAVDNHAKAAKTRDEFLNILASSMMDVYGEKEPVREFNSQKKDAAKSGHPLDATAAEALKASLMGPWTKIGRTKAEHITTKIPRSMVPVHLDATAPNATAAPTTPAPAKVAPVIADHHDEHHDDHHEAAPKPKPVPVAPVENHHVEKHHEEKPASPPPVAVQHKHHEEENKAVEPPTPTVTPAAPAPAVAKPPEPVKNVDPAPAHVDGKVKPHLLHLEDFPPIHAFVPPGGVQGHVEVMLFLHGMYAYYEGAKGAAINDPDPDRSMNLAGAAAATTRNLVTLAPVATSSQNSWPHWKELAENGTFPKLIKKALEQLSTDMSIKPNLEVGSISLAGHSAGGQGIGFAAGQLMDAVHDVTMEDGGYGNGKSKDWAPAHRELGKWLLGGKTDKILRVMYRKGHDHSEGDIIQSVMNPEKLEALAHSKGKDFNFPEVTVTRDEGNKDKRTVKDAYLDHVLHIHGRPGTRTVNVFVVNTGDHMRLRNDVTQRLMTEGRDTEFEQGVTAPTGALSATGPMPEQQDHDGAKHVSHANKAHHEDKPAPTTPTITPTPANAPPAKIEPAAATPAPAKADTKHHHKEAHHDDKPEVLSGPIKATHAKHGYDRDDNNLDSYGNPTERQRGRQINSSRDDHRVFTNPFNVVQKAHLFTHDLKETKRTLDKGIVLHTYAIKEHNNKSYAQIETVGVSKDDDLWINFADLGGHGETNPHFGNEDKDDKARGDAIKDRLPKTGRKPGESKHHWGFAGKFLASSEGVALDGSLMAKINRLMEWAIAEDMVTGNIMLTSGVRPPQTAHKLCIRYQLAHQNGAHINFEAIRNLKDGMYLGWKWLPDGPDHSNEAIMKHAAGWMYATYGGGGAPAAAGYPETDKERRGPILMDGPKVSMHCPGHAVDVKIPWRNEKNPAEEDVWGWEEVYHQFGLTRPLHKDRGGSQTPEYWHVEETGKKLDGVEGE
jgi:hypothetical protein